MTSTQAESGLTGGGPAEKPEAVPVALHEPMLQFDATQPLTGGSRRDFADKDDPALTAFVESLEQALDSRETHPVPPCPHCLQPCVRLHLRPNRFQRVPQYKCKACKRLFSRRTGSPLAGLRHATKMPAFIRLLSQPIPMEEAARRLRVRRETVAYWLMRFRQLIELHDPDRLWIARATLGLHYRPEGTCPHCEYAGQLMSGGFGFDHRRRAKCPECLRTWPMVEDATAAQITVSIAHDPARSKVERRLRDGLPAPVLTGAAKGILNVPPRHIAPIVQSPDVPDPQAHRFDFAQPLRSSSPLPRHYVEDTGLTALLKREIDRVLAHDDYPVPPCPHCASTDVCYFSRQNRTPRLPVFHCGACARTYTRVTRTALANSLRPDTLRALLPWLSQQRPAIHAAEAFGVKPETIIGLVKRFRAWLLKLDPSGEYERRVRLGLKAPWPLLSCPKCEQCAPAKPHRFARRKSVPTGQLRLFRCSACSGFFTVPVGTLQPAGDDGSKASEDAEAR